MTRERRRFVLATLIGAAVLVVGLSYFASWWLR